MARPFFTMRSVFLNAPKAPRNPRIYKKRIKRAESGIRAGEPVAVRTSDSAFVGRAFYNPRSVIAARILDREEKGPPVDRAWFFRRIQSALALRREALGLEGITNAYRVVHAEGDELGALMIDRFADVAVIEVGSRGMFEHVEGIESCVRELLGVDRVVVRADKKVEEIEGFRAFDRRAADVECEIFEHDLRFRVQCSRGHKTGFFVDQREARREVAQLARGRHVLDLCCYTGGFSLAAARGGAKSVRGVDLDEEAIAVARENGRLNSLDVSFEHADAFDALRAGARADLIVLDPPKLASSPRELGRARAKSIDFNALALEALQPGGLLLTFSCTGLFSSEDFLHHLREASVRAGRPARVLRVTGQPPDHPVHLDCPEGRYLSGVLLEVP